MTLYGNEWSFALIEQKEGDNMDTDECSFVRSDIESDDNQEEHVAIWPIFSFGNAYFFESISSESESTKSNEEGVFDILVLKGWRDLLVVIQNVEWDFIT